MATYCPMCDRPYGKPAPESTDPDVLHDQLTHARARLTTYRHGLKIGTVLLIGVVAALVVAALLGITPLVWITAVGTAAAAAWIMWWYAINVGIPHETVWFTVTRLDVAHNKAVRASWEE